MRLEQWSHIRNAVKEQRNYLGSILDRMEEGLKTSEVIEIYSRYREVETLWFKFDEIVEHMDLNFTQSEIENIDY